jgi:hypothetical protein
LGKPKSDVLFPAVTIVNCPQEMLGVRLAIGSNPASMWWVNGKEVIGIYGDRQTVSDDGVSRRLTLNKGPNIVRAATQRKNRAGYEKAKCETSDVAATHGHSLQYSQMLHFRLDYAMGTD